jgi:chromosome segregation ATPase
MEELIIGIVVVVFGSGGLGGLLWRSWRATIDDLRKDTAAVRVDLDARSVELVQAQSQIGELKTSNQRQIGMIEILQKDNAELRQTITELEARTDVQQTEIAQLTNDHAKKDKELARLRDQNAGLFEQNKQLAAERSAEKAAYKDALREIRDELTARESTENKPDPAPVTGAAGGDFEEPQEATSGE